MEFVKVNKTNKEIFKQTYITALREGFVDFAPNNFINQFAADFEKYYNCEQHNHDTFMYICYNDNIPIGVIVLGKSRIKNSLPNDAEIDSIYFKKDYCGKGFAKLALDFAENYLKKLNYNRLVLWCSIQNKRAWRFYEKNGFVASQQVWDDVLDGKIFNNILLIKPL